MRNKEIVKDYILITISSILMATAVNMFFKEHMLAPGGITGLSIIFSKLFKIPIEYMSLGISVPLLLMGIIFLGKSFGIKTLYITIMVPIFLKIIPQIHITNSLFIASIIGGILVGSAIGISIVRDCTTGGTDLAAMLINKVIPFIKMPIILFILDGSVVIASGLISKNYMVSIYSMISLLIIIVSINFIIKTYGKKES